MTLNNAGNAIDGEVSILDAQNVTIASAKPLHLVSAAIVGDLSITSDGRIHNEAGWTVGGTTVINAAGQDVVLPADHTFTGAITVIARNLTINDVDDIQFADLTLSGNLTVTSGGNISASGVVTVGGRTDLTAGGNTATITMSNAANNFGGSVNVAGVGNVALTDVNAMVLASRLLWQTQHHRRWQCD